MSIKTILTTIALVAGSSTAALARPIYTGHGPVIVHDQRQVRVRVQPRVQYQARSWYRPRIARSYYIAPAPVTYIAPQPTYIAPQPTYVEPALTTSGQSQQFLNLGGQVGSGLEISLVQGEDQAFVDQVIIHYADGRDVPMHLDRSLDAYNPELQLQTENCAINGVTVIGSGAVTAYRL